MKNRIVVPIVVSAIVFKSLFVFAKKSGSESCSTEECKSVEDKYKEDPRWTKYLEKISKAEKDYVPCPHEDCQCYSDIWQRDLAPFKGGIDRSLFQSGLTRGVHYQIIKNKLYRQEDCIFESRCNGVEHFILELIDELPNMEFVLNTHDWPQISVHQTPTPVLSFSKDRNYMDIMYPAWTFWEGGPAVWPIYPTGLGRWDQQRDIIPDAAKEWPWEKKLDIGFFRGSRTSEQRDPLVLLSRSKPHLVDAQYTKNQAWKSDADTLYQAPAEEIKLEDHCKYKYLFNFRGVAASFRFKHLFLCGSLVFHVQSDWLEFFYPKMLPWIHYIPVNENLSDAEELLEFAMIHDDVVKKIAERGREFIMQHLKMSDVSCYWRHLLTEYSKLIKYKVKRDKSLKRIKSKNV